MSLMTNHTTTDSITCRCEQIDGEDVVIITRNSDDIGTIRACFGGSRYRADVTLARYGFDSSATFALGDYEAARTFIVRSAR